MIEEKLTYTDYNGNERTESFYFNLTRAELAEMELSTEGGYAAMLEKIIAAKDQPTLIKIFKELILKTYGKKSTDGRRFIKSKEISDEFSQTEAYSDLFMTLATDAQKASEFVNGVMPKNLRGPAQIAESADKH